MATTRGHPEADGSACWRCGAVDIADRMVRLEDHPEVMLCIRCSRWAAQQAWSIEDRGRTRPGVSLRNGLRRGRRFVIDQGWHHSRFGRPIRWAGKRRT